MQLVVIPTWQRRSVIRAAVIVALCLLPYVIYGAIVMITQDAEIQILKSQRAELLLQIEDQEQEAMTLRAQAHAALYQAGTLQKANEKMASKECHSMDELKLKLLLVHNRQEQEKSFSERFNAGLDNLATKIAGWLG